MRAWWIAGLLALGAFVAGVRSPDRVPEPELAVELVPFDGRTPVLAPARDGSLRVFVALSRPSLGALVAARGGGGPLGRAEEQAYLRSLAREARSLRGSLKARRVELRDVRVYGRLFNGFAASVDPADLPGLYALGLRVAPVRRCYGALGLWRADGAPPAAARAAAAGGRPVAVLASGAGRPGYDAVSGAAATAPAGASGTALTALVVAAGEPVAAIRVADERERCTTDVLLAGLERAVDPDGDGATDDHAAVALLGVAVPYAGFAGAPEARAAAAAAALGTPVVAPAGHEGPAGGPYGTLASPAAAEAVIAAGALRDRAPRAPVVQVRVGAVTVRAAVLAEGPGPLPLTPAPLRLLATGERAAGEADAALRAGAQAVVLTGDEVTTLPAGRVAGWVLGVTGTAGERLRGARGPAALEPAPAARAVPRDGLAEASSRGPAFAGAEVPVVAAPAVARVPHPGGGAAVTAGGAVAAARLAVAAARELRARPGLPLGELRARLVVLARERGWATGEDAGARAGDEPDDPVPLGPLRLARDGRRVTGATLGVGAFTRVDGEARLVPAAVLELELLGPDGRVVQRLTPPGGERDLLPAEYAYALPRRALRALAGGPYRFRARARAPRSGRTATVTSPEFRP